MSLAERHSPKRGIVCSSHCRSYEACTVLIQCRRRLLGCWVRLTAEHDAVHMRRRCWVQLCHSCAVLCQLQLRRSGLVIERPPCSCSMLGTLDTLGTAGEGLQLPGRRWHATWRSRTLQERLSMLHARRASLPYKSPVQRACMQNAPLQHA